VDANTKIPVEFTRGQIEAVVVMINECVKLHGLAVADSALVLKAKFDAAIRVAAEPGVA
jgi:hypothetical protein